MNFSLKNILKKINVKNINKCMDSFNKGMKSFDKIMQDFGNSMDQLTKELNETKTSNKENINNIWGNQDRSDINIWSDNQKNDSQKINDDMEKIWGKKK